METLNIGHNNEEKLKQLRFLKDEQGIRSPKIIDDTELINKLQIQERGIILVGHIEHTQSMLIHELSAHRIHHIGRHEDDALEIMGYKKEVRSPEKTEELLLNILNSHNLNIKEIILIDIEAKKKASLETFADMLQDELKNEVFLIKNTIEKYEYQELDLKNIKPYDKYAKNFHTFHNKKPGGPKGQYSNSRRK